MDIPFSEIVERSNLFLNHNASFAYEVFEGTSSNEPESFSPKAKYLVELST